MSILNIENFRQTVAPGFQKPNKYLVQFPIPPVLSGLGGVTPTNGATPSPGYTTLQNLQYYADSCDLAGVGVGTVNIIRYGYGASEKSPFAPIFNDLLITFYNDVNSNNLKFFQVWLNSIQNFNMQEGINAVFNGGISPYESFYKDDYAVDGIISLLSDQGEVKRKFRPRKMWPTQINEIKLAWQLRDIMKFAVFFNYMDWYIDVEEAANEVPTTPTLGVLG